MRSKVTQLIQDFNALNEVEQKVFLDQVDPQPEPEPEIPAKKARKKRAARSTHAESLSAAIAKTPKADADGDKAPEGKGPKCGICGNPEEYQDHFKPSPNYHPFESTAQSATRRSSRKGAVTNFTPNSETSSEGALAVSAGGD